MSTVNIHFSDFFGIPPEAISEYGAFNISLVRDLPLFIDPFLLFNSEDEAYKRLHDDIIKYLKFLRDTAMSTHIDSGLLRAWYYFPEVKQTWLGFSNTGNDGRGLGKKFAETLRNNLNRIFKDFGQEQITTGTHLEKLTLVGSGVGRDMVSDFTTNLIKRYLCDYTQSFAHEYVDSRHIKRISVGKANFNYETKTWENRVFELPWYRDDYVLLTPANILTRLDTWINRSDMIRNFHVIARSIPNQQLRAQINNYLHQALDPKASTKTRAKQRKRAINTLIRLHPEIIDHYIRHKEDTGDEAVAYSEDLVEEATRLFVEMISIGGNYLAQKTDFYRIPGNTYDETHQKIEYLKNYVEHKGGHSLFWVNNEPVRKEKDVQLLFKLVWHGTPSDVSSEENDGRGPADFKISRGSQDKTLVEFKIGSNPHLQRNLERQTVVYEKASDAKISIKVIVYFDQKQEQRVKNILRELEIQNDKDVVLIDARVDNKPSGSKA